MSEVRREGIQRFYTRTATYEWTRLVQDAYHRLEYDSTLRVLKQHLPVRGRILDVGGGPGRYSIALAKLGHRVTLVDPNPELLAFAAREARRARVGPNLERIVEGSLPDLPMLDTESFDGVLCLGGALGHVVQRGSRERAVTELARVAKVRAPLVISVIGRYALLASAVGRNASELASDPGRWWRILRTGDYDGRAGFTAAHFFRLQELESLVSRGNLGVIDRVGLEGLSSERRQEVATIVKRWPSAWAEWKRMQRELEREPEVVATSEHILLVAEKVRRLSRTTRTPGKARRRSPRAVTAGN